MRPFLIFFVSLTLLLTSCSGKERARHHSGIAMGTFCDLTFYPPENSKASEISSSVFRRMGYLESLWSIHRKESEIYRLNQTGQVRSSPETRRLLTRSVEISEITGGAFDITVAPLMAAWREAQKTGKMPEVKKLLSLVDYRKIKIASDGTVSFLKSGMAVDLGGVGKGAAVDEAAALLKSYGVKSGMVNLGGNIYAFGDGPRNGKWRIGIQNPKKDGIVNSIIIKDCGVSTSGNYQRYFEIAGKRYSHILNPKTGTLENFPDSVTVMAPDAALADGLSTAFEVLGPEKGMAIAEKIPGVEVLFIMSDGRRIHTKNFPYLTREGNFSRPEINEPDFPK